MYAPLGKEQRRLYDAHEQHLREELTRQRQMRKQRALDKAAGRPVSDVEVLAEPYQTAPDMLRPPIAIRQLQRPWRQDRRHHGLG